MSGKHKKINDLKAFGPAPRPPRIDQFNPPAPSGTYRSSIDASAPFSRSLMESLTATGLPTGRPLGRTAADMSRSAFSSALLADTNRSMAQDIDKFNVAQMTQAEKSRAEDISSQRQSLHDRFRMDAARNTMFADTDQRYRSGMGDLKAQYARFKKEQQTQTLMSILERQRVPMIPKSMYTGDMYQLKGGRGRNQVFRQAGTYTGGQPGQLSNRASTNSPVAFQTQRNYSQTFSGPIKLNEDLWRGGQNQGMAQASFVGDARGYEGQTQRKGVQAGNKMQAYTSGMMGDAEAAKAVADANKQRFTAAAENAAATLAFQERQAGEQGWLRDLLLDRDDVNYRTQMADYKREVDRQLGLRQREVENEMSARRRESMVMQGLFGGMGRALIGGLI